MTTELTFYEKGKKNNQSELAVMFKYMFLSSPKHLYHIIDGMDFKAEIVIKARGKKEQDIVSTIIEIKAPMDGI